jgi:endonuclease/exonuclease/phosphatase family metal-dependent hydrolase
MEFRVGNFNLRNLTLPNFRFYENLMYSEEEYQKKCNWCVQQLKNMSAPIVAFQEVFHYKPLHDICVESGLYSTKPNLLCPSSDESEPRVALVSKYPITEWKTHTLFPSSCQTKEFQSFRRPFIEATIEIPCSETNETRLVRIFAVHLKSKRALFVDEDPYDIEGVSLGLARSLRLRCQEAIALRHLINQNLDIPNIIIGDFNDTAHSVTSQIIRGPYLHSDAPKEVLETFIRARLENTHDFARRRSLHDVHYTYIFNGQYETVDHIFVSQHFRYPTGKIVNYQTFTDHLIDRADAMQPIHTSDHGQVVATLNIFEQV